MLSACCRSRLPPAHISPQPPKSIIRSIDQSINQNQSIKFNVLFHPKTKYLDIFFKIKRSITNQSIDQSITKAINRSIDSYGNQTARWADFCPTSLCPRFALYRCLSIHYTFLRLYFSFPVFQTSWPFWAYKVCRVFFIVSFSSAAELRRIVN